MMIKSTSVKSRSLRLASVFVAVLLLCGWVRTGLAQESKVDLNAVVAETQKMSDKVKVAEEALEIAENTFGPDSHQAYIARSQLQTDLNNLAMEYCSQGKYAEAESLLKRAIAMRPGYSGTTFAANLAFVYKKQGKYAEAEPLYKQVLDVKRGTLGEGHPDLVGYLHTLAEVYQAQGKYTEAVPLLQQALVIDLRIFGEDHPAVAIHLNKLAELYRAQGKYTMAETFYEMSLAILEKARGPDHPAVATVLQNMAELYKATGKKDEAKKLEERAKRVVEKGISSRASTPDFVWVRQFGSSTVDESTGVCTDSTGVYVVGWTRGALPGQSSAGTTDAFIRKYDRAGNELWTRQFGSPYRGWARAVWADSSGVYVVGDTEGVLPGQTRAGKRWKESGDAFIRKYDRAGNELWTRQFGSSYRDKARGVCADSTGVYVLGITEGTLPGQTRVGKARSGDAFVRKYDANGNELWTRQFGTSSDDASRAVCTDSSGVYVVGVTYGAFPGQTRSAVYFDGFMRKYDRNGNELWTRQFGSPMGTSHSSRQPIETSPKSICVGPSGLYLTGWTDHPLPGQRDRGGKYILDYDDDAFLRKYDPDGAALWARQFGIRGWDDGYQGDYASGVCTDSTSVYVAGWTFGALPGQSSAGKTDVFVRKYDANGNELWTRQFGTSSDDDAHAVCTDSSGVYVVGATLGTLSGQISAGSIDAFVIKLSLGSPP